ncbi:MAG TPA: hypothetical protein VFX65_03450 [Candidatus Limnocylindrales bacterium]|nr:hypothetical protein [Candidatus Limnocylindrales bacterium]
MNRSGHNAPGGIAALPRRASRGLPALIALFAIVGSTSLAAAYSYGGGGTTGKFAATFETRSARTSIASCPALGPDGRKIEGRYLGTMTIDGEEFGIHFVLEALVDVRAGLGSAEGRWHLTDPRTADVIGRGELIATVTADPPSESDPPGESDPPSELTLHGVVVGTLVPSDPELPGQRLIGNFSASLGDGMTFPHLKGTVGDPTGVADPTHGELLPAVVIASEGC